MMITKLAIRKVIIQHIIIIDTEYIYLLLLYIYIKINIINNII